MKQMVHRHVTWFKSKENSTTWRVVGSGSSVQVFARLPTVQYNYPSVGLSSCHLLTIYLSFSILPKSCTVCPGSSDPPEKMYNIFASENEFYTIY